MRFLWQADRQTDRGRKKEKRRFRSLIVAGFIRHRSGAFLAVICRFRNWVSWLDLVDVEEMVDSHFFGSLLSASL
jgi:hypothetical protein